MMNTEALDTLFDAGRAVERAAIVAWLRNATPSTSASPSQARRIADGIEALDHLNPTAGDR